MQRVRESNLSPNLIAKDFQTITNDEPLAMKVRMTFDAYEIGTLYCSVRGVLLRSDQIYMFVLVVDCLQSCNVLRKLATK